MPTLVSTGQLTIVDQNDGYTLTITGGTRSFVYNAAGNTATPSASAAFAITLQKGSTTVTPSSYSWIAAGRLVNPGTTNAPTFTPTVATAYSADPATTISVTVVHEGSSISQTIPISISKVGDTGATGATGYTVSITGGSRSIVYDAFGGSPTPAVGSAGTFTATVYRDGAPVTSSIIYTWSAAGVYSGANSSAAGFTPTLTATHSSAETFVSLSVEAGSPATVIVTKLPIAVSKLGAAGASSRTAYTVNTTDPTGSTSITVTGDNLPPTAYNATASATFQDWWNSTLTWSSTAIALTVDGQKLFQSDGLYTPSASGGTTIWSKPYLSSLRVGSLEAITANTGNLTVSGSIKAYTGTVPAISGSDMTGTGILLNSNGSFAMGRPGSNILGDSVGNIVINGNLIVNTNDNLFPNGNLQSVNISTHTIDRFMTSSTSRVQVLDTTVGLTTASGAPSRYVVKFVGGAVGSHELSLLGGTGINQFLSAANTAQHGLTVQPGERYIFEARIFSSLTANNVTLLVIPKYLDDYGSLTETTGTANNGNYASLEDTGWLETFVYDGANFARPVYSQVAGENYYKLRFVIEVPNFVSATRGGASTGNKPRKMSISIVSTATASSQDIFLTNFKLTKAKNTDELDLNSVTKVTTASTTGTSVSLNVSIPPNAGTLLVQYYLGDILYSGDGKGSTSTTIPEISSITLAGVSQTTSIIDNPYDIVPGTNPKTLTVTRTVASGTLKIAAMIIKR